MNLSIDFDICPQPTDSTCGPTCLEAVYKHWRVPVALETLLREIPQLPSGGTLAVQLALDALKRGMETTITTFNLHLFDPTWFRQQAEPRFSDFLAAKLEEQLARKANDSHFDQGRLVLATQLYREYLQLGGRVQMLPLEEPLITRPLSRRIPVLCGLSATYLYQESRERDIDPNHPRAERGISALPDDTGGYPSGHFVVLHGFDASAGEVEIADPQHKNPFSESHQYRATFTKLATAILLGIITYDANLLAIAPQGHSA